MSMCMVYESVCASCLVCGRCMRARVKESLLHPPTFSSRCLCKNGAYLAEDLDEDAGGGGRLLLVQVDALRVCLAVRGKREGRGS